MQWWKILLMIAGTEAAFILTVWLLLKKYSSKQLLEDASQSNIKRLEEEAKTQKKTEEQILVAIANLKDETVKLQAWYIEQKDLLSKEKQDEFKNLSTNPDDLDKRIAEKLGTTSTDGSTNK